MKFDYKVNHNGVYYMAGEDVPIDDYEENVLEEGMSNPEMEKNDLPFSDHEIEMEEEPVRRGRPRKIDL